MRITITFKTIMFLALMLLPVFAQSLPKVDNATVSPMRIVAAETNKGAVSWVVELAADDQSRATGLMHRKSMEFAHGMLFRFDDLRPVAMWMKNTFIPLDMVFMDETGQVTHIHRGAIPHDLSVISSQGPARYVLEVNEGEADLAGLTVGTRFRHPWFAPVN